MPTFNGVELVPGSIVHVRAKILEVRDNSGYAARASFNPKGDGDTWWIYESTIVSVELPPLAPGDRVTVTPTSTDPSPSRVGQVLVIKSNKRLVIIWSDTEQIQDDVSPDAVQRTSLPLTQSVRALTRALDMG